jgi:hypothetical protein
MHPYEDVRVVGDPQLLQEQNVPKQREVDKPKSHALTVETP